MKMSPHKTAVIFALCLVGGTAVAADLKAPPPPQPLPPTAYNSWTGLYLGGNVGGVWAHASDTFINNANIAESFTFDYPVFSLIGGGHVGAQRQLGSWVLGAEGTFSAINSLNQTQPSVVIGGGRTRSLQISDIATVVGRVGYAWNNWLPYVKGGWADSRINTSSTNPNPGGNNSSTTQRYNGWTIGGGVDYMVVQNWIVGVDFNYYSVTFNNTFSFVPGGLPGAVTNSQANVYAATARLTYLFNGSGPSMWTY